MNEHELLKKICDKIGYETTEMWEVLFDEHDIEYIRNDNKCFIKANVREVIFRQDFMDKFIAYRGNWNLASSPYESLIGTFAKDLLWSIDRDWNLNNPVKYLAELIWIK